MLDAFLAIGLAILSIELELHLAVVVYFRGAICTPQESVSLSAQDIYKRPASKRPVCPNVGLPQETLYWLGKSLYRSPTHVY